LVGDELDIVVYEKAGSVGGRAKTFELAKDDVIELGASIIAEENKLLVEAIKKFKLPTREIKSKTL